MKLSDILSYKWNRVDPATGRLDLSTFDGPTLEPTSLGPRAAEIVARASGRVYGQICVRFGGHVSGSYQWGNATFSWDGECWSAATTATWDRYAPQSVALLFGRGDATISWECDDAEIGADVVDAIRAAMAADDVDRAERVVLRPRPGQIVVSAYCAGDAQSADVLLPDGTVLGFTSTRVARNIMATDAGVSDEALQNALQGDAMPGRSECFDSDSCCRVYRRALPLAALDALRAGESAARADWQAYDHGAEDIAFRLMLEGRDLLGWSIELFSPRAQKRNAWRLPRSAA